MRTINYETYKKPSDFMKFDVGDNLIRVVSDGYFGMVHGMNTARGWINLGPCTRPGPCKHCEGGNKPKKSWKWVVIDRKIDEARLLDAGPMIGNQICEDIAKKNGDPRNYDLIVHRVGEKLKTSYKVFKGVVKPITEEERKKHVSAVLYLKKTYIDNEQ